jgi:hypothetical protein
MLFKVLVDIATHPKFIKCSSDWKVAGSQKKVEFLLESIRLWRKSFQFTEIMQKLQFRCGEGHAIDLVVGHLIGGGLC